MGLVNALMNVAFVAPDLVQGTEQDRKNRLKPVYNRVGGPNAVEQRARDLMGFKTIDVPQEQSNYNKLNNAFHNLLNK